MTSSNNTNTLVDNPSLGTEAGLGGTPMTQSHPHSTGVTTTGAGVTGTGHHPLGTGAKAADRSGQEGKAGTGVSHATDPNASKVPVAIQKAVPEKLERVLPESIHPTGDAKR